MAQDGEVVDRGDVVAPPPAETVVEAVEITEDDKKVVEEVVKAEEKPVEEAPRDEKGKFVPRERFNEAVEKERERTKAAAARAAELEGQLQAQTTSQDIEEAQKLVREMVKQRNSLLGDGKLDEASEVDNKILSIQEAVADRKAEIKAEQSRAAAVETMKYDVLVERLEMDHPELNPDSDEYDEDTATELRALMRGYQSELKMSPAQALQRAAKRFFGTAPKAPDVKVADEGVRRKQEATERNIDAAKKQPASTKDVGLDHDKKGGGLDAKTVMTMKYDEFMKLGDDVLSRLRGDTL